MDGKQKVSLFLIELRLTLLLLMANQTLILRYLLNEEVQTVEFANELEFRSSIYSESLIQAAEGGTIDLTSYTITPGQVWHMVVDGNDFYISGDLKRSFNENEVIWSHLMERYILTRYAHTTIHDDYATSNWLSENDYYQCMDEDDWRHVDDMDDYVWCHDVNRWAHCDSAYYPDEDDFGEEATYYEPNSRDTYDFTKINGYHSSSHNVKKLHPWAAINLGYEFEKATLTINGHNRARRNDTIGEFDLFAGYEHDGSCGVTTRVNGVEAVTHILSGDMADISKVHELMDQASDILNSPVNDRCGGHISISAQGKTKFELAAAIRPALPILYSLWRDRLLDGFCNKNILVHTSGSRINNRSSVVNLLRNNGSIELRLPPRVEGTIDAQFRHELICRMCDITIIQGCADFEFIKLALYPFIKSFLWSWL